MTTINEYYKLPSNGKLYGVEFDPIIKLRSMTVAEEMKRLSVSEYPYRNMSEIIEDCLETKLPVKVYDLCLGDYQYLLHKLRTVTYGPKYNVKMTCPFCGESFNHEIDLDEMKVNEFEGENLNYALFTLPVSGKTVEIKLQTPRDLDNIEKNKKQYKKEFPDFKGDPTLMLNIASMIKTIDGEPVNPLTINTIVKNMPMQDSLLIIQNSEKLNSEVGVSVDIEGVCPGCGEELHATFRFTNEFFRPIV